jgi:ribulose-5-phosphate 4-epimerase/fuculose-1-phosphate aldolase
VRVQLASQGTQLAFVYLGTAEQGAERFAKYRLGDARLADELTRVLQAGDAALLANHGTILTGKTLLDAAAAAEKLEETAKIYFLLNGKGRFLTPEQVAELNEVFRN